MGLTNYKLGSLIQFEDERNIEGNYTVKDVKGVSIQKMFIETKADMSGVSLTPYILVKPGFFVFVPITSRNGEKITLAFNNSDQTFIVSSAYVVFSIQNKELLDPYYLFMYFNRPEFDRYSRFNSWGSAREAFTWEEMCDIDIVLPPLTIQQQYANIYKAMIANQQSYERGLEDLKKVFDSYIDKLRKQGTTTQIGNYLDVIEEKNEKLLYGEDSVRGISIEKKFIYTKANMDGVNLKPYYVVKPNEFAYVSVTSRNGEKISLAINDSNETYICSSSYIAFKSKDTNILWPKYLMLFLLQSEFDRYARFNSWGSARETFDWEEMCNVQIPIPDIQTQKAIADIFTVYTTRKKINEQLKAKIKAICPILIRGSLSNGG